MASSGVTHPGSVTPAEWIVMEYKSLSHYLPLADLLLMNLGPCTMWLVMSFVTAKKGTVCMSR